VLETVYIYTLADPRTGEVRYVGKTFDLRQRFFDHICKSKKTDKRKSWIKSLRNLGLKPVMEVLETLENCDEYGWQETESFWIEILRFYGCRLTNLNSGGEGGRRASPELRARLSKIQRSIKRTYSDEFRKSVSEKSKARMTPEIRAHLSKISRQLRHSEETKKHLSEIKKGIKRPPHAQAALLEGSRQWKLSQGFTPNIICVSCHKVIKVNRLKSGQPNDKQKWFREGVGYIHNLCLKKLKNSHSANGCTTSAVTIN